MTTVTHEIDGGVGIVTLAKPPHNLIDGVMIDDLMAAYEKVVADGCRAILLRSSMRHFSAGAQLRTHWVRDCAAYRSSAPYGIFGTRWRMCLFQRWRLSHGGVLGGGLELALTCDLIIAADTAFLGQVEMIVGLLPLLGGTQRLQRCGYARAKEITLPGRGTRRRLLTMGDCQFGRAGSRIADGVDGDGSPVGGGSNPRT